MPVAGGGVGALPSALSLWAEWTATARLKWLAEGHRSVMHRTVCFFCYLHPCARSQVQSIVSKVGARGFVLYGIRRSVSRTMGCDLTQPFWEGGGSGDI